MDAVWKVAKDAWRWSTFINSLVFEMVLLETLARLCISYWPLRYRIV